MVIDNDLFLLAESVPDSVVAIVVVVVAALLLVVAILVVVIIILALKLHQVKLK